MKRKRKNSALLIILIVAFLILMAMNALLLFTQFTWAAGGLRERNAELLDLRGKEITLAEYRDAAQKLPDCSILWDVPFQGKRISSASGELSIASLSDEDLKMLAYFPELRTLNAQGCRDYQNLMQFRDSRPECTVCYDVPIGTQIYAGDAQMVVAESVSAEELSDALDWLLAVQTVELTGTLPAPADIQALRAAFPEICFHYQVPFGGAAVDCDVQMLNLAEKRMAYEDVYSLISLLPELRSVDLRGSSLTDDEMLMLVHAYPACCFLWDVPVAGMTFPSDVEEIDISGQSVAGAAEIESRLVCFPNLQRVIMCGCGLDDETMDALNRRYEDIRFIWSVKIKNVEIRTDAKWFYPFKYQRDMIVNNDDVYPLRYCTDMEGIDVGHMTTITDCEWAAFMPNLKYLIIVETAITDISPLANLKNLVFLEIFTTKITDYTPLLGCTALQDLNLGNTYGDEEPIMQMTWLKNLWWSGILGTHGKPCSDAPEKLQEALPNTKMKFNLDNPNVDNGWRQLDNYYAMRDLMEVFYLT